MFRDKTRAEEVPGLMRPSLRTKDQLVSRAKSKQKSVAREYVEALLVALLLALFIRSFIVQAFKIPSGSMLPTLQIGDHILVNKLRYGIRMPYPFEKMMVQWGRPARGDVVVFV